LVLFTGTNLNHTNLGSAKGHLTGKTTADLPNTYMLKRRLGGNDVIGKKTSGI
jgi:hypothetical protein